MTDKAPIRAYHLTLELGADTLDELAGALMNLSLRADRGELTRGVSGGPSSGYIYVWTHWAPLPTFAHDGATHLGNNL